MKVIISAKLGKLPVPSGSIPTKALANAIGPMVGASVTGLGLQAPFILSAGVLGVGTLVVVLWVRERS